MKLIIAWILIGFFTGLLLALPAKAWLFAGLFTLAGVTALGFWAMAMIIKGFIRGLRS
jgi:hypothetical protein